MKRWQKILPTALIGMSILASGLLMQPAFSQYGPKKVIYLFSTDFPPHPTSTYPTPPIQQTKFWQLLDREMKLNGNMALTENMENADYRVELRCGGIVNCAKLQVDVRSMNRDVLASFPLRNIKPVFGVWGWPRLEQIAHELTVKLDERFKLLEQGGYGHTDH